MLKKHIKRYMPPEHTVRNHPSLRCLSHLLHDPNLWHLNRRSVSGAFAVGLFMAFVPLPLQMLLAAVSAIFLRVNLPLSVALVWVSNPLTMGPLFYFAYLVGMVALGHPAQNITFEWTLECLLEELSLAWQPFLLGCFITGTVCALLGYTTVRILWRWHAIAHWKKRRQERAQTH